MSARGSTAYCAAAGDLDKGHAPNRSTPQFPLPLSPLHMHLCQRQERPLTCGAAAYICCARCGVVGKGVVAQRLFFHTFVQTGGAVEQRLRHLLFRQVLRCCSGRAEVGLSSASMDALANGSSSEPQVRPNVATGPRVSNLYLTTCNIEPNSFFRKPNQALTSLASEATDGPFHKPPSRIDKLTTCRESSTLPHPLESPCPNTFCLGPGRTASLQLCQL